MVMVANPAAHLATDSVVDQFTDDNTGLQLLSPRLIATVFNPIDPPDWLEFPFWREAIISFENSRIVDFVSIWLKKRNKLLAKRVLENGTEFISMLSKVRHNLRALEEKARPQISDEFAANSSKGWRSLSLVRR